MAIDVFKLSWFIVFALVMLIALVANVVIIVAILRDKTMHTSTYFYIINVNIADIILVGSCLPERLTDVLGYSDGFHLGMATCYLLPFLQQVSMHAALAFLIVLTIHRCYPAGVPRFLQGDLIRRRIRNHSQTLCILWAFAVFVNLPLFSLTKYEISTSIINANDSNSSNSSVSTVPICYTGASEIWSRAYLILLLVFTYVITGICLIVNYGKVIRIILASNQYAKSANSAPATKSSNNSDQYQFISSSKMKEQHRSKILIRKNGRHVGEIQRTRSSSSSSGASSRRQHQNSPNISLTVRQPIEQTSLRKSSANSHSTQHIQVIIMLFIVIILYILLLLPYRLFNLLYIVHNSFFQDTLMNEILFQCLLNTVRLLVFLNCALQPITYLIISSRLRQTVLKLLRSWYRCYCYCRFSSTPSTSLVCHNERQFRNSIPIRRSDLSQKYQNINRFQIQQQFYQDSHPLHTSLNNAHFNTLNGLAMNPIPSRQAQPSSQAPNKTRYAVSFSNRART